MTMSANPRSPESGDVPEQLKVGDLTYERGRMNGSVRWYVDTGGMKIGVNRAMSDALDAVHSLTAELSSAREREKALSIRLANAELERDQIDRTLESAEVPDTLPDDPDETPLSRADRVEWLSDARDEAEHLLSTARERADRAEQRLDYLAQWGFVRAGSAWCPDAQEMVGHFEWVQPGCWATLRPMPGRDDAWEQDQYVECDIPLRDAIDAAMTSTPTPTPDHA